jgi:hypothetical protein
VYLSAKCATDRSPGEIEAKYAVIALDFQDHQVDMWS